MGDRAERTVMLLPKPNQEVAARDLWVFFCQHAAWWFNFFLARGTPHASRMLWIYLFILLQWRIKLSCVSRKKNKAKL